MAYGTLKCDNIVFDNGGVDKLITVSGLFYSTSGALTVTGTISGGNVTAPTATFATLTGTTTAGTTATFTSGSFTTLTGTTVTGTTANFTSGNFTSLSGTTTTVTSGVFSAGSATAPSVAVGTGTSNAPGIYSPGTDQVAISTSGVGRLFVDSAGKVGIGTTPNAIFEVAGSETVLGTNHHVTQYLTSTKAYNATPGGGLALYYKYNSANNYTYGAGISFEKDNTSDGDYGSHLTLQTRANGGNATERLRVTSAGLVGIGTSNPGTGTLLDVAGTLGITTGAADGIIRRTTVNGSNGIRIQGNTNDTISDTNPGSSIVLAGGSLTDGFEGNVIITAYGTTGSVDRNTIRFQTRSGVNSLTERMRISSGGNVGIGTMSPGGTLDIKAAASTHPLIVQGPSSEFARIDSSGRLLVGTSSSLISTSLVQVAGTNYPAMSVNSFGTSSNPEYIFRSARGTQASPTVSVNDDKLGAIYFQGYDGVEYLGGAKIEAFVDGAVTGGGTDDLPGRLVFSVTADGAASPTERMRITSAGYLKVSDNNSYQAVSVGRHELNQSANEALLMSHVSNTGYTGDVHIFNVNKAANSNYVFLRCYSDTFADTEFNLRGDGNAFADGSWTGGGADYAEYFEWSDSNPNTEDRRGISVVLDGDKIREAVVGEDPIGVISGNPSVVGDAAWNKWSGKYLRDEFSTYIQEDYDVTGDDGKIVTQQRRKLNPAYNPDNEYIPREQRPEWDCVGLMGKLRIRKDQITGSRWIKMRDISPSVEEWLVR